MNILFLADIVGSVGREVVGRYLPFLKKKYDIDLTIANAENSAHGKGITEKIYYELLQYGVDVITMGNHTFSKDTILKFIDYSDKMVRPINLEPLDVGQSFKMMLVHGKHVLVCNIMGEVFMYNVDGSPFRCMEEIIQKIPADVYFVDLHAEATSEKAAFANYFKDKVNIVVGTHTHVQTADERIIGNCAFITDVGMCGAYDSILGRDINEVLTRFTTNNKTRFVPATGDGILCGVVVEIDDNTCITKKIERIQIRPR